MSLERLKPFRNPYLATPYTKYDAGINLAWRHAVKIAADCLREGVGVYSPIVYAHPIAIMGGFDPLDHKIWLPFNDAQISVSDCLLVAMMRGWDDSYGTKVEIEEFKKAGKPVFYLDPATLQVTDEPQVVDTPAVSPLTPLEEAIEASKVAAHG